MVHATMKYALAFLLCLTCLEAGAAVPPPPATEIWLVDLRTVEGRLEAGAARNLTRRPGYDNQPAFVSDHTLLFTSIDNAGQADAWRLDLSTGDAAPILVTPQSEYSPTAAPRGVLTVVRVALDGVQQLWMLPAGADEYQLLFPMLEGVGYHAWLDQERAALFMIRGEDRPPELHIANRVSGNVTIMAKGIGRSLQPVPGAAGSLAFVEDGHDGKRWIKRLDFHERRITALAPVLADSEDFAFMPDGRPLMAQDKSIFVHDGTAWRLLTAFEQLPGEISRLAIDPSGTKLAMVVAEGA